MKVYRIQQKNFNSITQSTLSVEDGTKFQFIPTGKEDMYNVAYITNGSKENVIRCKRLVNSFQFLLPYDRLLIILKDFMGKPFEESEEIKINDFYLSCFPKGHPERPLEFYHVLDFTGTAFKVIRVRITDPLNKIYNPRIEYTTIAPLILFRSQTGIARGPETALFTDFMKKEDFECYMDIVTLTLKGDTNRLMKNEILYNSGAD